MYEAVVALLTALGYTVQLEDKALIDILTDKTEKYVLASCNIESIPENLKPKVVERIVGEFLTYMKDVGKLVDTAFNFEVAVKSVKEGDTQVTFAIGEGNQTAEQRFNDLLRNLINGLDKELAMFRRIKW